MKKILLSIVAILFVFVVVVMILASFKPDEMRVTRSAKIAASPAAVFEHVNNFHKWEAWSPWAKKDPNAKNTFEGPEAGEGAIFSWDGNSEVGEGKMTLVESYPSERIRIRLDFVRPFVNTSDVEFEFKPVAEGTEVIWSMAGASQFMCKVMSVFMDMDKAVGGDFEAGLANLKGVVAGKEAATGNDAAAEK